MSTAKDALEAAIWVTASPHEWTWTHEQQIAMARYCVEASRVLSEARQQLEEIVCVKAPDDGVILLSHESPCHHEPLKGSVYDHAHFSPLGDALIALHETLLSLNKSDDDT